MARHPIHNACSNDNVSEVRRMLDQDDSLKDLGSGMGYTPLMYCAEYGRLECLKLLGERGADVNRKNNNGNTAAHLAAGNGQLECLKYLVEHCGADVTMKNNDGDTPLADARLWRHQSCVEYLEEHMRQERPTQTTSSQPPSPPNPTTVKSSQLPDKPHPLEAVTSNTPYMAGSKPADNWTVDDVCSYLTQECGAPQDIVDIFRSDEVDGPCLLILVKKEENLKDMGVTKPAVRAKIISRLEKVQAGKTVPSTTAAAASNAVSQSATHDDILELFPKI